MDSHQCELATRRSRVWLAHSLLLLLLIAVPAGAQPAPKGSAAPAPVAAAEPLKDPLGRDTPRGAVLGFIAAARKESEAAPEYLNTRLRGEAAADLAHKLFVVLDSRLPARLNQLSDRPEGSIPNPLKPNEDLVGTIDTAAGPLDVTLERVDRNAGPVWLFSRATLDSVPAVFDEVTLVSIDQYLPGFLTGHRLAGVRVFEWLMILLGIPLCYGLISLLSRLLSRVVPLGRREHTRRPVDLLPGPVRLLLLALGVRWLLSHLDLPLVERQVGAAVQAMLGLIAIVWLVLRLDRAGERYLTRRLGRSDSGETAALVRLARRAVDALAVAAGVLAAFRYFGLDASAALTGLGIGGIAVALAAQKTLENVIGGFSIYFDKAVRVGDFLKLGDTMGTVDHIGLRSTRIRTLDRTILSVPNGQIANINIETISARDKCWFHHFIALGHDTTSAQMRAVIEGVQKMLSRHPSVDPREVRVRFLRLGSFSLDVEIFAYVTGSDWLRFLEVQQELLLRVMEIIEQAGTAIALPSQTLQVADARTRASITRGEDASRSARSSASHDRR